MLLVSGLWLSSCSSLEQNIPFATETGTLYRTSMMDASSYRALKVIPLECTKRYLSVRGEEAGPRQGKGPELRIRIEKNWPPDFNLDRKRAVIPMNATIEKKEDGAWSSRKVRGFVEFRDLSDCRIRRAAFVPSDDSSVLEPPLWILNVSSRRRPYWVPRLVILTAYRALVNETLTIVGPVPFRTDSRLYHPRSLINGVVQRKDLLRGVTPPDFSGNMSATLWLKGKSQEFKIMGEGDTGLFELRSAHTKGIGVFLPFPEPFYQYPEKAYRFALAGSLLVDGPFAFEGSLLFDQEGQTVLLKGRINEAGSVVPDFQIRVPYRAGEGSVFRVPGEIDFGFSFNHRRISLVLLPDADRKAYWIGAIDQNIFGIADPN